MKIILSTDDGEVIDIIFSKEVGNLDKEMASSHLLLRIKRAWSQDKEKMKENHPEGFSVPSSTSD